MVTITIVQILEPRESTYCSEAPIFQSQEQSVIHPQEQSVTRLQEHLVSPPLQEHSAIHRQALVPRQEWEFMSCYSYCQELGQQASWLLIGCT